MAAHHLRRALAPTALATVLFLASGLTPARAMAPVSAVASGSDEQVAGVATGTMLLGLIAGIALYAPRARSRVEEQVRVEQHPTSWLLRLLRLLLALIVAGTGALLLDWAIPVGLRPWIGGIDFVATLAAAAVPMLMAAIPAALYVGGRSRARWTATTRFAFTPAG